MHTEGETSSGGASSRAPLHTKGLPLGDESDHAGAPDISNRTTLAGPLVPQRATSLWSWRSWWQWAWRRPGVRRVIWVFWFGRNLSAARAQALMALRN
eukprot:1588930-Prymnesium_polylepis.1